MLLGQFIAYARTAGRWGKYHGFLITDFVRTSPWKYLGVDIGSEVLRLTKATKVTVGAP